MAVDVVVRPAHGRRHLSSGREFAEVRVLRGSNLDAMRRCTPTGRRRSTRRSVDVAGVAVNREDRDYPWLPARSFGWPPAVSSCTSFTTQYENAPTPLARVELVVQRRSPTSLRLIAYNLASTRYRDKVPAKSRRRVRSAAYGEYVRRLPLQRSHELQRAFPRRSTSLCPGYFASALRQAQAKPLLPSTTRNTCECRSIPASTCASNRTFSWRATRLTLFAESERVRPRDVPRGIARHQRQHTSGFSGYSTRCSADPSAGLSLEF